MEAAVTDTERPLCDCPKPCGCQPCRIKRAVLEKMLLASNSPTLERP